uniref:ATP synthase subunit a n=3 Tax=Pterandrus TaxID=474497 RepID=A0A343ERR9_CERFS|nr:ATP synthase F0 subunit 6 [Ceratitis fasciventris]YP_010031100.1 ATP synthase F0 subunit 6 [Ceratitis quilicii]YP_010031113.1 ATP synthase F0 subunit 6 [Ceratitis rosa]QVL29061.1 ATP synthase F0 subunit 6 [Ceratitis anonae]ASL05802.1 ATP synthase F0 subunit 6 [Ceratitis fasciventris]QOV01995.1 ATP synthase F0 subunit 6 [Ceratitis quilicii]QOV02008.1 ATP synthase F0 subunit 6 [Ceratitis rosa]QVL29074.1 ATP synthase F0 subunit 6 [Ceratitis anonae]
MMTNLFSVFDPSSSIFNLSLNWLSTFLGLLLIPSAYWLMPSRWHIFWNSILITLHKEFKTLLGPSGHSGSTFIFVSLFSLILFNNFMGLFPYIFTSTSHLTLTLTLALPLWLCFMLYGWINHTQHMFAHLVPQGTPAVLMPFMVCIETISNIIRPGTLAVRLAANMIAGHLLLTLLGNTGPSLSMMIVSLLLIGQIALLVLESAVAIIQSYVFAVLSTLYSSEVN